MKNEIFKNNIKTWEGKFVILKQELRNGYFVFPKGLKMRINCCSTRKVHLESLKCECCGVIAIIELKERKSDYPAYFEFIEQGD